MSPRASTPRKKRKTSGRHAHVSLCPTVRQTKIYVFCFFKYLFEAGSKCTGTLEIAGASSLKLKSNNAASRERVSIMTWVTSNNNLATCSKHSPIDLLFKAKSSRRTGSLICPDGTSVAVTWGPGSYREENIIAYLRRWMGPWTAERKASGDYRMLYLDVAKCHLGSKV